MGKTATTMRLLIGGFLMLLVPLAQGAMCGDGWKAEAKGDAEYAMALKAMERKDWIRAVAALENVVARRAWDDDAHTLLGFALRKLGRRQQSLNHYHRALELNPYHRGAMEYLGELYLQLGENERSKKVLARLGETCRRTSPDQNVDSWREQCTEWKALNEAIGARLTQRAPEHSR